MNHEIEKKPDVVLRIESKTPVENQGETLGLIGFADRFAILQNSSDEQNLVSLFIKGLTDPSNSLIASKIIGYGYDDSLGQWAESAIQILGFMVVWACGKDIKYYICGSA